MHLRRKARIAVLQALYAEEQINEDPQKIITDAFSRTEFNNNIKKFVQTFITTTLKNKENCDKLIDEHVQNWEFKRITLLDKLILRMAITEMIFMNDTPPKVAISEAIEIAKEFSTAESSGFVNGILDAVYQQSSLRRGSQSNAN